MGQDNATENLLFILAGNTIFWSVLTGMAVKTLKLDADKLESVFKKAYEKTDAFTFNATAVSRGAISQTLPTVYGSRFTQVLFRAVVTSVALNIYVLIGLHTEWMDHKLEITQVEHRAIAAVSPEYYSLITSEAGRRKLLHAEDMVVSRGGGYYRYNGPEDVRLRAAYRKYLDEVSRYSLDHRIAREITLARFFGDGYANIAWMNGGKLELASAALLMTAGSCLVTALAIFTAVKLIFAIFDRRIVKAAALTACLIGLFVLSLGNYDAVFLGDEGFIAKLFFELIFICFLLGATFLPGAGAKSAGE